MTPFARFDEKTRLKAQATYRCPDSVRGPDDVVGCGREFEGEPDEEGLVDCPHCGIWFDPKEPTNQPQPEQGGKELS